MGLVIALRNEREGSDTVPASTGSLKLNTIVPEFKSNDGNWIKLGGVLSIMRFKAIRPTVNALISLDGMDLSETAPESNTMNVLLTLVLKFKFSLILFRSASIIKISKIVRLSVDETDLGGAVSATVSVAPTSKFCKVNAPISGSVSDNGSLNVMIKEPTFKSRTYVSRTGAVTSLE